MAPDETFDIIVLSAGRQRYYPASMSRESWMGENHIPHDQINIPLGKSRYGGPVVDLPPGVEYPKGQRFAAQLNLADIAPHDPRGLLPKRGHLIAFAHIETDSGLVIYSDVPAEELCRAGCRNPSARWERSRVTTPARRVLLVRGAGARYGETLSSTISTTMRSSNGSATFPRN